MKKINIIIMIISIILILGCSGSKKEKFKPFDINAISDKENNDSKKNAVQVNSDKPIIGFFNKKNSGADADYYKVNFIEKNTSYKIVQTPVPGIDSKIILYSSGGKELYSVNNAKKGEAEKIWEYFPDSEFAVIKVEAINGFNEKVPYLIDFIPKKSEAFYENEPNNNKENAMTIRLNENKSAYISPKEDMDFYKIILDDNKNCDFSITIDTLSEMDIMFTIINEKNNSSKFINNSSWGSKEVFPFLSADKGEYYIKVDANLKDSDLKSPLYNIKIQNLNIDASSDSANTEKIYYEKEFNDTYKDAANFFDSIEYEGVFFPEKDEDWYVFELQNNAVSVNIDLSSVRGIDSVMQLYNSSLNIMKEIDDNKNDGGEKLLINNLNRGRYYLKIFGKEKSLLIYKLFLKTRY